MRSTRRNDFPARSIRPAHSAQFRKRIQTETASALDVRNRARAPEAQVLKFNGCRFHPPPPWRPVGDLAASIVSRLVTPDDVDDVDVDFDADVEVGGPRP